VVIANTQVRADSGKLSLISAVSIGDRLFSCNGPRPVSRILRRHVDEKIIAIRTPRDVIWCTRDTLFVKDDRTIIRAKDLKKGDLLLSHIVRRNGDMVVIPVDWTDPWRSKDGWLQRYTGEQVLFTLDKWFTGFMYSVELEGTDTFFCRRLCIKWEN